MTNSILSIGFLKRSILFLQSNSFGFSVIILINKEQAISRIVFFINLLILAIILLFSVSAVFNRCDIKDEASAGVETTEKTLTWEGNSELKGSNNPPYLEDINVNGSPIGCDACYLISVELDTYTGEKLNFSVKATDDDGDSLSYDVKDSMGSVPEISKIDNNNIKFQWVAPDKPGDVVLRVSVDDGNYGQDSISLTIAVKEHN